MIVVINNRPSKESLKNFAIVLEELAMKEKIKENIKIA
jgi:hypothetical protein